MDLTHLIDRFLDDRLEGRRMSLRKASRYRFQLVGSTVPFVHVGYVRFLKSFGIQKPDITDLNSFFIGRYWEFLIQHYGGLQSQHSMEALRALWTWCIKNDLIHDKRMPPDLKGVKVAKPYRVKITVTETK